MNENNLKSSFAGTLDYKIELDAYGKVSVSDQHGKPVELKSPDTVPSFKKITNVRTLTIIEAEGSICIYMPGVGWCCC